LEREEEIQGKGKGRERMVEKMVSEVEKSKRQVGTRSGELKFEWTLF
jgi:hypothetical protein